MKQQKQTITIEYTQAPVLKCVARQSFDCGGQHINAGETFYFVRSSSDNGEYHLVAWSEFRQTWQCSCGAGCKKHAHTVAVNTWIAAHVVKRLPAHPVVSKPVQASRFTKGSLNGTGGFSLPKSYAQMDADRKGAA